MERCPLETIMLKISSRYFSLLTSPCMHCQVQLPCYSPYANDCVDYLKERPELAQLGPRARLFQLIDHDALDLSAFIFRRLSKDSMNMPISTRVDTILHTRCSQRTLHQDENRALIQIRPLFSPANQFDLSEVN